MRATRVGPSAYGFVYDGPARAFVGTEIKGRHDLPKGKLGNDAIERYLAYGAETLLLSGVTDRKKVGRLYRPASEVIDLVREGRAVRIAIPCANRAELEFDVVAHADGWWVGIGDLTDCCVIAAEDGGGSPRQFRLERVFATGAAEPGRRL